MQWDDRKVVREEYEKIYGNKDFEILEHPSDIRIKAFGKTKEELFLNAMKGMIAVLKTANPKVLNPKSQTKLR